MLLCVVQLLHNSKTGFSGASLIHSVFFAGADQTLPTPPQQNATTTPDPPQPTLTILHPPHPTIAHLALPHIQYVTAYLRISHQAGRSSRSPSPSLSHSTRTSLRSHAWPSLACTSKARPEIQRPTHPLARVPTYSPAHTHTLTSSPPPSHPPTLSPNPHTRQRASSPPPTIPHTRPLTCPPPKHSPSYLTTHLATHPPTDPLIVDW